MVPSRPMFCSKIKKKRQEWTASKLAYTVNTFHSIPVQCESPFVPQIQELKSGLPYK